METNAKETMSAEHLQEQINELDGEMGVNCANIALNALKQGFEEGLRLDLDETVNQRELVNDLNVMIAELLYFRKRMNTALLHNGLMEPAEVRGDDLSEIKQLFSL